MVNETEFCAWFKRSKNKCHAMSIRSVFDIAKNGWGLEDEDLDKIIRIENLKDKTQKFSDQIKTIVERFNSVSRLRIVAFNEQSGVERDSKVIFMTYILGGRNIFYHPPLSNKECCVVLIYPPKAELSLKTYEHILCHEYAHHIQFAHAGFPCYIFKRRPPVPLPPFLNPYEVGPKFGSVFVDGLRTPNLHFAIHDFNERLSDIICEGLLREKNLILDFFEWYQHNVALYRDPALDIPQQFRTPFMKRYVRRLGLRDNAEWGATVRLAYPKGLQIMKIISQGKRVAVKFNKRLPNASQVHDEIFDLCLNTGFRSFKSPEKAMNYTKKVLNLLNIKIKTSEKW